MQEQTEQIFRRNYRKLYLTAVVLLRDSDAAKDIVGDVFEDIASGKLMVRPETEEAFLHTCVRNRCLNRMNHMKVREKMQKLMALDAETYDVPVESLVDKLDAVRAYIGSNLTEQTARIVRMHYLQKMTYKDIARSLGISEAAVYKHLSQGIRKLQKHFNP